MSKEKQIDEIAKLICTYPQCVNYNKIGGCKIAECQTVDIAEKLFEQGYRKASSVALEVIGEVEEIINKFYNKHCFKSDLDDIEIDAVINFSDDISTDLDKLKNKYTEDGK